MELKRFHSKIPILTPDSIRMQTADSQVPTLTFWPQIWNILLCPKMYHGSKLGKNPSDTFHFIVLTMYGTHAQTQ